MGYELEKLKNQYGVSSASRGYYGATNPVDPGSNATAEQKNQYQNDMARYTEDRDLYNRYITELDRRIATTNLYKPAEYRQVLDQPVYSYANLATAKNVAKTPGSAGTASRVPTYTIATKPTNWVAPTALDPLISKYASYYAQGGEVSGGLKKKAEEVRNKGRDGDTLLAHISPQQAAFLRSQGGAGTINPHTGLPEYYDLVRQLIGEENQNKAENWVSNTFDPVPDNAYVIGNHYVPNATSTYDRGYIAKSYGEGLYKVGGEKRLSGFDATRSAATLGDPMLQRANALEKTVGASDPRYLQALREAAGSTYGAPTAGYTPNKSITYVDNLLTAPGLSADQIYNTYQDQSWQFRIGNNIARSKLATTLSTSKNAGDQEEALVNAILAQAQGSGLHADDLNSIIDNLSKTLPPDRVASAYKNAENTMKEDQEYATKFGYDGNSGTFINAGTKEKPATIGAVYNISLDKVRDAHPELKGAISTAESKTQPATTQTSTTQTSTGQTGASTNQGLQTWESLGIDTTPEPFKLGEPIDDAFRIKFYENNGWWIDDKIPEGWKDTSKEDASKSSTTLPDTSTTQTLDTGKSLDTGSKDTSTETKPVTPTKPVVDYTKPIVAGPTTTGSTTTGVIGATKDTVDPTVGVFGGTTLVDQSQNMPLLGAGTSSKLPVAIGTEHYDAAGNKTVTIPTNTAVNQALIGDLNTGVMTPTSIKPASNQTVQDLFSSYANQASAQSKYNQDRNNYIRSLYASGTYDPALVQQWERGHIVGQGAYSFGKAKGGIVGLAQKYAGGGRVKTHFGNGGGNNTDADPERGIIDMLNQVDDAALDDQTDTQVNPTAYQALLDKYKDVDSEALRKAREASAARQQAIIDQLASVEKAQEYKPNKAEAYFRLAQAFLTPGKTGSFMEALGNAGGVMADYQKEVNAQRREAAANALQLQLKQKEMLANMAKEELQSLESQQAKTDAARREIELAQARYGQTKTPTLSSLAQTVRDMGVDPSSDEGKKLQKDLFNRMHPGPQASATSPAPTMATIVDPTNPSQTLVVDARTYKGGGANAPGVIGLSNKGSIYSELSADEIQKRNAAFPGLQTATENTIAEIDKQLAAIQRLKTHPGLDAIVGPLAGRTEAGSLTKDGSAALNLYNTVTSKALISALANARSNSPSGASGFGELSKSEGATLRDSQGSIGRAQDKSDFLGSLSVYENDLKASRNALTNKFNETYAYKSPDKPFVFANRTKTVSATPKDADALDWLKKNPNDPNAKVIRSRLEARGINTK